MALVIPAGYGQVLIPLKNEFVLRPAAITFGIQRPPEDPPWADVVDSVVNHFLDAYESRIDPSVTIGPGVVSITETGGITGSISGTVSGVGTRSTGNSIPPQIAAIVRKRTNRPGRAGRGRFFLPWCLDRDDVQEDGALDGGERNLLQTASVNFLAALETEGTRMFVLHTEGVALADTPTLVQSLDVDLQSGTQRRRNRS